MKKLQILTVKAKFYRSSLAVIIVQLKQQLHLGKQNPELKDVLCIFGIFSTFKLDSRLFILNH